MTTTPSSPTREVGIVLTGGGARAAYQVGFLCCLADHYPDFRFRILTGVSAGAINTAFLACHTGSLPETVADLRSLWLGLTPEKVFRVDGVALFRGICRWSLRLVSGGSRLAPRTRGLVDTTPLNQLLHRALKPQAGELAGIEKNLEAGRLRSVALSTVDYSTGRTATWVEGEDIHMWQRTNRYSLRTHLTVDHVMASAALPILFPAVQLGGTWHGDGGVRLATPLAPAIHLGADRLIAISTRYRKLHEGDQTPVIQGYPPPAQVAGVLMNAIFLDNLDQDARTLERINGLVERTPTENKEGLKPIKLTVLRPSEDLGKLAGDFEARLPRAFRFLTRGLGTRETKSPDLLSLLMFQPDYVKKMIEIGVRDAEAQKDEIAEVLD